MWYVVSLLLKANHLTRPHMPPIWEERLILLSSSTDKEAVKAAKIIGKGAEHEYEVDDGKSGEEKGRLKLSFEGIDKLVPIEGSELAHGTELFSCFLSDEEVRERRKHFGEGNK